ncbi:MAG: DNA-3-methyladenine glycosylase, partial [Caulobacteraceae bacterium]
CSGPGKLCQALAITAAHDGAALDQAPFELHFPKVSPPLVTGARIGISKAAERAWRFGWRDSPFLSRPFAR